MSIECWDGKSFETNVFVVGEGVLITVSLCKIEIQKWSITQRI